MIAQDTREMFASLDELQTSHLELTQKFLYGGASLEKNWQEVEAFITKARATGAVLSNDSERHTAQNLIDDWTKKLTEVRREVSDTELFLFDESLIRQDSSNKIVTNLLDDGKQSFPSLLALQTAHAELSKRCRDGAAVSDEVWQEVKVFIAKGKATGALLEDDNERYAAQSLLDYWATMLYRYKQDSLDTTLFPFDESSVSELTDDDYPYRNLPMPPSNLTTARELRFAIEGPAKAIGLVFEDGVIEALLRDVRDEKDAWVLLELKLAELWQKRQRNKITWAAYQELGSVANLLSKKAETFYEALDNADKDLAKKLLLKLVRLDERQQPVSHPVPLEALSTSLGGSSEKVEALLLKLERASVIKRENDSVRLFHPLLLEEWSTLAEWLEDATTRQRLALTSAAEKWEANSKDKSSLWRGKALNQALNLPGSDKLESDFINASSRRRDWLRGQWLGGLSVGLVLVLGLAGLAVVGWRRAIGAQRFAEAQSNIVTAFLDKQFDVGLLLAVKTYRRVNDTVDEISAQKGLLSALRYTQQAYAPFVPLRYLHGYETEIAQVAFSDDGKVAASDATFETGQQKTLTVWNVESGAIEEGATFIPAPSTISVDTSEEVFRLEPSSPLASVLNGVSTDFFEKDSGSKVSSAALSPDGQTLALGYKDKSVILWRVQTPERPFLGHQLETLTGDNETSKVAFSETGNHLALTSTPNELNLFDLGTDEKVTRIADIPSSTTPRRMAVSPDGQLLAWLETGNQVKLWDRGSRQEIPFPMNLVQSVVLSLAFSSDNELLLGQQNSSVSRWSLGEESVRNVVLQGFERSVVNLALNQQGVLAVSDSAGLVSVWSLQDGKVILGELPLNTYVTALAFNKGGTKLALGTRSGTIILWDTQRQETFGELSTNRAVAVSGLAFIQNEKGDEELISSSSDGSITVWDISFNSLVEAACNIANPPLDETKYEQYRDLNEVCSTINTTR